MNPPYRSTPNVVRSSLQPWEAKFSRRQTKFYRVQDRTVLDELREDGTFVISIPERPRINLHELREAYVLVEAFLKHGRSGNLDPSTLFDFGILKDYLASADVRVLLDNTSQATNPHADIILLDDRRDTTGGPSTSRLWDSDEYLESPPQGENIFVRSLKLSEFVSRLRTKVDMPLMDRHCSSTSSYLSMTHAHH